MVNPYNNMGTGLFDDIVGQPSGAPPAVGGNSARGGTGLFDDIIQGSQPQSPVLEKNQTNEQVLGSEFMAALKQGGQRESLLQHEANTFKNLATGNVADLLPAAPNTVMGGVANAVNKQLNVPNAALGAVLPEVLAAKGGAGLLLNAVTRAVLGGQMAGGLGTSEGERTANQKVPYKNALPGENLANPGQLIVDALHPKPDSNITFERSPQESGEMGMNSVLNALGLLGLGHVGEAPTLNANKKLEGSYPLRRCGCRQRQRQI